MRFAGKTPAVSLALVLLALGCVDATAPVYTTDAASRNVGAQAPGDVFVVLQTDPDGATDVFTFTHTFGLNSSPQVASPFTLRDGRLEIFNSVTPGSYTLTLVGLPEWNVVNSGDGYDTGCWDDQGNSSIDLSSGTATIDVGSGEFVVCTFVVNRRAMLSLAKRENGALPLSRGWTFDLRTGASETETGVVRATATADVATGEIRFSCAGSDNPDCAESAGVTWLRAQEYQLCETAMPAGLTNSLAGFTPGGSASEGHPGAAECVSITLLPGQNATSADVLGAEYINNFPAADTPDEPTPEPPPPLTDPHGTGGWKHSASCGKQKAIGGSANGQASLTLDAQLLSGQGIFPFGVLTSLDCAQALHILAREDFVGHSRANDAAYNLAAQLLTAKLNRAAGASVPECVASAIAAAQQLLLEIGFVASGEYLPPRTPHKSTRSTALELADLLGHYNDGSLNGAGVNCNQP